MSDNETQEIERKFLVLNDGWKQDVDYTESLKQVYVSRQRDGWLTRLRIINDERAEITIKGPKEGISGAEYNIPMDMESAKDLWEKSNGVRIEKDRNIILNKDGTKWEIDEFKGSGLDGIVLAEIELKSESQDVVFPDWVGLEVSGTRLYSNDYLAAATHETEDGVCTPNMHNESTFKDVLVMLDIQGANPKAFEHAFYKNMMKRESEFGSDFTKSQILQDDMFIELLKESGLKGTGISFRKLRLIEEVLDDGMPNEYHKIFEAYSKAQAGLETKNRTRYKM